MNADKVPSLSSLLAMSPLALGLGLIVASYLVGSIPFGYVIGRVVKGIDIRQHGSGNIGATNVGRVLGGKWLVVVLILDLIKGITPVAGLSRLMFAADDPQFIHWQVASGIAAVLGHMFPCWLGFRGGKGVATALGVIACLSPWGTLAAAGVFALTFVVWRLMSLSSILGALAFAACQLALLMPAPFSERNWSLSAFSLFVPAMIVVRHRTNIVRLLRGEENKFRLAKERGEAGETTSTG